MILTNKVQELPKISSIESLKRIASAQTIVVIGPTSSGKSTFIYNLINSKIYKFISNGIGDNSQTTIIPSNFLLDSRIEDESHFAIKVKTKRFSRDLIHTEIFNILIKLCLENELDAEETLDAFNNNIFEKILKPASAAYHLGSLKEILLLNDFKKAIANILRELEKQKELFQQKVDEEIEKEKEKQRSKKEKINKKKKVKIESKVLEELLDNILDSDKASEYAEWFNSIELQVTSMLNNLFENKHIDKIQEFNATEDGGKILKEIFNPFTPYSLLVEEITLACKPRNELIENVNDDNYIRFCLRDTMGLNQTNSTDENLIEDALDAALSYKPDSILILLNLGEREDVLSKCCDIIANRIKEMNKHEISIKIPINIIFTKADIIIDNLISKCDRDNLVLGQSSYDANIKDVIHKIESSMQNYSEKFDTSNIDWIVLRYYDKNYIQNALTKYMPDKLLKVKPEGLYKQIYEIIQNMQKHILPKGVEKLILLTVKNTNKPAITLKIKAEPIKNRLDLIQDDLINNEITLRRYLIQDETRIHGKSVTTYHNKLPKGQRHKTHSEEFGNFDIHMKGLLNEELHYYMPKINDLCSIETLDISLDNLQKAEIYRLINILGINQESITDKIENSTTDDLVQIEFHKILIEYFNEKYYEILDKVSFNLSYGNEQIRNIIDTAYYSSTNFDRKIRTMQEKYKEIFSCTDFSDVIIDEFSITMTEMINKLFVII